MTKVVRFQDIKIQTATVAIQAMVIGPKQMTLAIFRQLIEEAIIDENLTLRGVPWGHVRYLLPEPMTDDVRHIVWQKGGELRRCIVERGTDRHRRLKKLQTAGIKLDTLYWTDDDGPTRVAGVEVCLQYHLIAGRDHYMTVRFDTDEEPPNDGDQCRRWLKERSEDLMCRARETAERKLRHEVAELEDYTERYDACVDPLFEVPQLFIAV